MRYVPLVGKKGDLNYYWVIVLRFKRINYYNLLVLLLSFALLAITIKINFLARSGDQHFVYLSRSIIQGKLYFTEKLYTWHDTAYFNGKYYWPLGVFPAIILIPFVYVFDNVGMFFYQGYLQFFLLIGIFTLVYKLARKIGYGSKDCFLWALTFCFGSVFIGVAWWPWSWFYSQVVTVFLLLLLIYGVVSKYNPLYLGIISGLILLTRTSAFLSLALPSLLILLSKETFRRRFFKLMQLSIPVVMFLIVWLAYNHLRFGNPLEQGYKYQILATEGRRSLGIFSYKHLPANLYYMLLSVPEPVIRADIGQVFTFPFLKNNEWGMSVFITSPYLIYLFFCKNKSKFRLPVLLTSFAIAVPIVFYYGIGARQYGFRYSLDFLPILYFLLMDEIYLNKEVITKGLKTLIIVSIFVNVYLYLTLAFN